MTIYRNPMTPETPRLDELKNLSHRLASLLDDLLREFVHFYQGHPGTNP